MAERIKKRRIDRRRRRKKKELMHKADSDFIGLIIKTE